ncbi:MAG: hypothetical protein HXY22_05040 [Alphaproteobacteria bacterium]|nr:hypothetical protein [Alphaproteobacteria bacterium]
MAYEPLNYKVFSKNSDPENEEFFRKLDSLFHDVYGMFSSLPPAGGDGGGGNFSIALVLICILDAIGKKKHEGSQRVIFNRVVQEMTWPCIDGHIGRCEFADIVYVEIRNILVHAAGVDDSRSWARPQNYKEPNLDKWNTIKPEFRHIEYIDTMQCWPKEWAIVENDKDGRKYIFNLAGLYYLTKELAKNYLIEKSEKMKIEGTATQSASTKS